MGSATAMQCRHPGGMLLALCLALAWGIREAGAARNSEGAGLESAAAEEATQSGGAVACYCREVEGTHECVDNKHRKESSRPDGPHFFHAASPEQGQPKALCCKREFVSLTARSLARPDRAVVDRCERLIAVIAVIADREKCYLAAVIG